MPGRGNTPLVFVACLAALCLVIAPVMAITIKPPTIVPGATKTCVEPHVGAHIKDVYEDSPCNHSLYKRYLPATIQFIGSDPVGNAVRWRYDFYDGSSGVTSSSTERNPVATFTKTPATFSVHAWSDCGDEAFPWSQGIDDLLGPSTSTVVVATSPSGAWSDAVWTANGKESRGLEAIDLPAGTSGTLTINKAGFQPFTKTFLAVGGKNICIEANLVPGSSKQISPGTLPPLKAGTTTAPPVTNPAQPAGLSGSTGSLYIISTPSGAAIFLDSDAKGTTPATLTGIAPGTHTVLLKKSGYPDYTTPAAVVAGQVTTIDADLAKGPGAATPSAANTGTTAPVPGEGSLSVGSTPPGAQVLVDGTVRGMTPAVIPGLSPGQHTILLKLDGYQEFNTTVSISDGKTTEFSTALAQAKKSPGFAGILAIAVVAALALFRKRTG
jgi:hypothetical protein